jgi:replication factor C small subunit
MTQENNSVMWVEKYRPKTLDEVVNLKNIVESLKGFLKNPKTMPHLLFAGIPGTGKTTLAMCIASHVLGSNWRNYTLELNASDERGINIVRKRIKEFSRYNRTSFSDIPYSIIILDESDQMTASAQTALRRIMETSSRTSRFILICNYSSRIIEPIQSRCAIFRFSRLEKDAVIKHLKNIADKENINLLQDAAETIFEYSEGDLRRAINALQTASVYTKDKIDENTILQVIGEASPRQVLLMLTKAIKGEFMEARDIMYKLMGVYGLSGTDILHQLNRELFKVTYLSIEEKAELANILGEYDFRLTEGASVDIQLSALLAQFSKFTKLKEK